MERTLSQQTSGVGPVCCQSRTTENGGSSGEREKGAPSRGRTRTHRPAATTAPEDGQESRQYECQRRSVARPAGTDSRTCASSVNEEDLFGRVPLHRVQAVPYPREDRARASTDRPALTFTRRLVDLSLTCPQLPVRGIVLLLIYIYL